MAYNPYSAYSRRGDEVDDRQALLDALDEPPAPRPPTAQPRTPARTPQQTREMLDAPGGRTQIIDRTRDTGDGLTNAFSGDLARTYMDPAKAADIAQNAYNGDRFADERQERDATPASPSPSSAPTQPPHTYNPQTGFDLMDAYDDPYTRRMEGSPGVGASAAKGASLGGSIVPGYGHAIGAAAGAIGALFAKNAKTAMTDFAIDDARAIISQAHKDAFGRDIDPAYLDQIVRGQGWEDGDRWMGQDQLAYVLDAFAQQAPGDRAATAAANAAAATPAAGATPAGATAGATGGGLSFSGFDFNRAQDPSKSAKDAFAAAAQQAPPMTDTSKAGAEVWFREHIAPRMEAAGYRIFDLQGDKAWVGSKEDPEGKVPVDWLINAGGSNPQIGWQPDDGGGGAGISGGAENAQAAYQQLVGGISPNASKEEMESAIEAAFGHLPGYGGAYKESVMLDGQWYDLVRGYGGAGAEFQGLVPKGEGGGASVSAGGGNGLVGGSGLNLAPGAQLAAPLGRSDVQAQIMAEIQRILSGAPPRDEVLEALG
jgi:hypothetical protein